MFNKKLYNYFLIILISMFMLACKSTMIDNAAISDLGIKNLKNVEENVYSSGQPTQQQIDKLAKLGVKHIINLRPDSEMAFNEGDFSKQSGLNYHNISVNGAAGVTKANAKLLGDKLKALNGEPVLVHCGSGNRVGALVALNAAINGKTIEQSIAEGKKWGLTKLENNVREKLKN